MTKGERIKKRREELGLPQTEVADSIGVSKQTLYKYENDIVTNIPSDKIEALARKLGVTPAYILGWDQEILPTDTALPIFDETDEHLLKIIEYYKNATPEAQSVVETVLKSAQQKP